MNDPTSTGMDQHHAIHPDMVQELSPQISNHAPMPGADVLHNGLEIGSRSTPLIQTSSSAFKKPNLVSSIKKWLRQSAWPGMGLFGESYLLFSIGTLKPIWESLYPDCFSYEDCPPRLLHCLTYSVVLGVIVGMIGVGYMANAIGRRRGSILTASLMSAGAIGLFMVTFIPSPLWLYRCMSMLLFVFGLGVGGEYPLSASSASENAMQQLRRRQPSAMDELDQRHQQGDKENNYEMATEVQTQSHEDASNRGEQRGRQIQLVFTMQGLGVWFNSLSLMLLLLVTGQTGKPDYDLRSLIGIWRFSYFLGAAILVFVLVSRYLFLTESQVWTDDKKRREQQSVERNHIGFHTSTRVATKMESGRGSVEISNLPPAVSMNFSLISDLSNPTLAANDQFDERILKPVPSTDPEDDLQSSPTSLLMRNYGTRLAGASMSWLLWDISFYGNKLFQSSFLLALTGDETTLLEFTAAATLNATVALAGYFGAAYFVDNPYVGRVRLQSVGFLVTGSLFLACGFSFEHLSSGWLVAMYLASSFFGQLGPNCTTFLIPAEIFPTEMRTLCHGICAASGKVGALIAAILFNFLKRDAELFLWSGYASFLACFITVWTIPETNGMDLLEIDRKWRMTLQGRKREYTGAANHPDHLSMYERWKLGLQF